jgi:hypothetical protein
MARNSLRFVSTERSGFSRLSRVAGTTWSIDGRPMKVHSARQLCYSSSFRGGVSTLFTKSSDHLFERACPFRRATQTSVGHAAPLRIRQRAERAD